MESAYIKVLNEAANIGDYISFANIAKQFYQDNNICDYISKIFDKSDIIFKIKTVCILPIFVVTAITTDEDILYIRSSMTSYMIIALLLGVDKDIIKKNTILCDLRRCFITDLITIDNKTNLYLQYILCKINITTHIITPDEPRRLNYQNAREIYRAIIKIPNSKLILENWSLSYKS